MGAESGHSRLAHASWNDLGFVSLLSPHLGPVVGELSADVTVDGTLAAPKVTARGQLHDGGLSVPDWGLDVRRIEGEAASTDLRNVVFTARGLVGEGQAVLDGATRLDPAAGWPTRLTLHGEALEVVRLPEAEIDVSPELAVDMALPEVRVEGILDIPRARLSRYELPAQAVSTSDDAVVHGVRDAAKPRPWQLHAELQLTLGDDVTYTGGGLSTELSGALDLAYDPVRAGSARGVVELAGHYELAGQRLGLERGRLVFAGPLTDPGLDVRAAREIRSGLPDGETATVRVGVHLAGSLQRPRTRMFSEPAMNEADALSYLVLDRASTGLGRADASTLQGAALAMGLHRALPVVQRLGKSVGLDELAARSTNAGELMAGKHLGPRLYVRYTYGLFNRVGGLLVRFRLTDRLSLETRSGDAKSMDILYVVDRD